MIHFSKENSARSILERPEIKEYLNIFISDDIISGITEEYMDRTVAELEGILQAPWGGPFIGEVLLDAAERVEELVEKKRFEFISLWTDKEKDFIPVVRDNNKDSVCFMKIRYEGPEDTEDARPAAVICPGGGYHLLSVQNEGIDFAQKLEEAGWSAFILMYRVEPNRYPKPQMDLALAIKTLRANAEKLHIDPDRIIIMGSSAAGHLCASETIYHQEIDMCLMKELKETENPLYQEINGISALANGLGLVYPVIDFTEYSHEPSFLAISGANEGLRDKLSIQLHINSDFPKTYVWACEDDESVPFQNSVLLTEALKKKGIPVMQHIFPQGGHGCGLAAGTSAEGWIDEMIRFFSVI